MSSNDRRNEPIAGEAAPRRATAAGAVSSAKPAAVNGDPRDEKSISGPSPRVRARPKRPISHRAASPIPQPVTADDSGSIATVADAFVTHADTPAIRTPSTNGTVTDGTVTDGTVTDSTVTDSTVTDSTVTHGTAPKGPTKGNGTTQKRRPQKAAGGRNGNRGPNLNGGSKDQAGHGGAVIFDPGMIRDAPAPPEALAQPDIEPVVDAAVEPVLESGIDSARGDSGQAVAEGVVPDRIDAAQIDGHGTVDSHQQTASTPTELSVIDRIGPAASGGSVVAESIATPHRPPTTVELPAPAISEDDARIDGHGTVGDGVSDLSTPGEAPSRWQRKPLFAGLIQRVKASITVPAAVVPDPPATADGRVGDLPPPLAPPALVPSTPVSVLPPLSVVPSLSVLEVIAPTDRVRHAPVPPPRALRPQVPDFPSPTRRIPVTPIGLDTTHRTRPNYIDAEDDEPARIPTIKRPVRSAAPAARRRPRIRRVTRVIRHVDPWSVFKVAVCFSAVLYGVCLTAGVMLWNVAYTTGTVDNIERFFESFGWDRFEFKGGELYHSAWIAGLFAAVGLTGLIVLAATLFNLITDLVGGIRVTVLEEEVVERDPAKRRPALRGRRVEPKPVVDPFDPDAPLESLDAMRHSTVEPVWVEPARDLQR